LKGPLHVRPEAIAAARDGSFRLQPAQAEHYLNYNGEGYEAPATLYKLSWQLDAKAADYTLTIHYKPSSAKAGMDVWVDGQRYALSLADATTVVAGAASSSMQVHRDRATHPYAMQVEVTPTAPFVQGAALPVDVQSVDISPRE
jgi:alpha-L-fucosidase